MNIQFFIDFDGTIAPVDIGHAFFMRFARPDTYLEAEKSWRQGEISSTVLYQRVCSATTVREKEFEAFLAAQPIDPSFPRFLKGAVQTGDEVYVLSDGFENYIRPLLGRHQIQLAILANKLSFAADGQITPVFPYLKHSCGRCANCKGYHVKRLRNAAKKQVFIGNGLSDGCGALKCQHVFAKDDLMRFCREKGIPCIAYNHFGNLLEEIDKIRRA